jgi:hypothetical protein
MEMRPFGKFDWYGFAGAEGWEDSPPLMSTEATSTHLVILDKTGGNVYLDEDGEDILILDHKFKTPEEAREFARKIGDPKTVEEFKKFGFQGPIL